MEAKFILSKKKLLKQVDILKNLGLVISYSYKTNREVGNVLQELTNCFFSIHAKDEIEMINDKSRIWFFLQAESEDELKIILEKGVRSFVVDNEIDLQRLLKVVAEEKVEIALSLRMKCQEHRIGTGKYFVYGMVAKRVNELILNLENEFIKKLGVHIHRKSQNASEWEIEEELKDSLSKECLNRLDFVNFGGGLPSVYRSLNKNVFPYIFEKIKEAREWLDSKNIQTIIEPGRFLCAPCIKLETEVIQIQGKNIVINTTIYNCALDNVLTGTKMLVEGEKKQGEYGKVYLIKGNSPTRDDIFRYDVKLDEKKVGDKIVFLNAGAYNYTTDFFGYKKLETEIVD